MTATTSPPEAGPPPPRLDDGAAQLICKDLVRRQMNRSGNLLLGALEPLSDEEFFAGGSSGVSAAWTVGHLACVADLFSGWISGDGRRLPDAAHDVFNTTAIADPRGPDKASLVDPSVWSAVWITLTFRQAQVRAFATLEAFDVARWGERPPRKIPDDSLPTLGAIWENLAVHTYWHMGELAGSLPRFHGTTSMNTLLHYFYDGVLQESIEG